MLPGIMLQDIYNIRYIQKHSTDMSAPEFNWLPSDAHDVLNSTYLTKSPYLKASP